MRQVVRTLSSTVTKTRRRRVLPKDMPDLRAFLEGDVSKKDALPKQVDLGNMLGTLPPYLQNSEKRRRKVFVETYGCQMNVSDSEVINSILQSNGFEIVLNEKEADVLMLNTCAIRDKAEQKIHTRLGDLKKRKLESQPDLIVGVVGCMAERLKTQLLEKDKLIDLVVGPDAYNTLPQLLQVVEEGDRQAMNVLLSADETYADVTPVRTSKDKVSAFVSISRGCDNFCS
jgi:tRNA-2-methylthio-N6-dimethylallyladenosine synthase